LRAHYWRDRIFASIYWIATKQGNVDEIDIPVAKEMHYSISTSPIMFESPISYTENLVEIDEVDEEDILEDKEFIDLDEE